jgi:hypothetical protein
MSWVGMGENILDEVVTVLITGDVDQWDSRTVKATLADTVKVTTKEINTTDLEALLNDLGGELVHTVFGSIANDMVDGTAAISWGTMLTDVLDAPVAKLAMSHDVDATENLLDARALMFVNWHSNGGTENTHLVFLKTVLKYILNNQAASLTKSNFMPHAAKSFVNILHDLRRRLGPAKLKQLLPDMASIAVNNSLWNTAKKLMDHDCLVIFRNRIKRLLNDMAAESIHREVQSVASNGLSNLDDLFRSSVLEAALNQEVTKAIDHQWISL